MNAIHNVDICIKKKKFTPRDYKKRCEDEKHKWHIIAFLSEEKDMPGLAICKDCAMIDSGWVDYIYE